MNHRNIIRLALISAGLLVCQTAVPQRTNTTKSVPVPMPKGVVVVEASNIDKDWNPPIVHLRGSARVRIYTATGNKPGEVVLMRADEVDLDQTTGEISPRGNVHITVEERK